MSTTARCLAATPNVLIVTLHFIAPPTRDYTTIAARQVEHVVR
eukprot:SAG11_NODE_37637_length_256_cov_0.617834_1_plen_42_part_10